jgi:sulfonate transport system substrate-binding protein
VTGRGSIGHFLILKVLERAHIAPGSVDLIFMAPADAAAALRSGAVDAWATWGPYVATAEAAGNRILADGRDYFSACSFDVVHESVLRQKPEIPADFLRREAQAMVWRKDHLAQYAGVLARETGLPLPIALTTAQRSAYLDGPITPELVGAQQAILDTL